MSDFNPGEGWVEGWVPDDATGTYEWFDLYSQSFEKAGASGRTGSFVKRWHRRLPDVPALPTEPYTVIRVTWKHPRPEGIVMGAEMWLCKTGAWVDDDGIWQYPESVAGQITGFEVLAEPRAVTAKAVLERVRRQYNDDDAVLRKIGTEFGVAS